MMRIGWWLRRALLGSGVVCAMWGFSRLTPPVIAAPDRQVSATPAPVVLPTFTPTLAAIETVTPTRTPTPIGPALAEALEGPTNVRAGPDIEAERLGQIFPGEFFPVLGRAAGTLWLKIQYPDSPSGTAWVFEQVVRLTGDVEAIPDLNVFNEPTIDVNPVVASQTIAALAQTPGALATATAEAFAAGVVVNGGTATPGATTGPLPTFTFPPGPVGQPSPMTTTPDQSSAGDGGLPPIIPIIALGALGILGLLVGALRRMG